MALGKYTVPAGAGKAGSDDELCKGEGSNGLQKDFEKEVKDFLSSDALKELKYTVTLGERGYITANDANELAKTGNGTFKRELAKFGWGLGWEIQLVKKNGARRTGKELYADSEFKSAAEAAGLKVRLVTTDVGSTSSAALIYFYPSQIEYKASAEKVEYDASAAPGSSDGSSSGDSSSSSIAAASYFFANEFNAVTDAWESQALQGVRALANDEPLWNYVKKAVNASLRACSSDPDGNFIAWYPDYFGKGGLECSTIVELHELIDLTITQSDKEFYSHVFCPGVNFNGESIQMMFTQGVVAIESDEAALADSALVMEQVEAEAALENAQQQYKDASAALKKAKKADDKKAAKQAVKDATKALKEAKKVSDKQTGSEPSTEVSEILAKMLYIPEGDEWKYSPAELYRRYGARPAKTQSLPNFQSGSLIEDIEDNQKAEKKAKEKKSNKGDKKDSDGNEDASEKTSDDSSPNYILPYLYALYEFMYHWANQYQAKIQVTFMPEVFPGSRVRVNLPSGKYIEFYVQSVTHNMSYTSGFTTTLGAICPKGNLVSGMIA